MLTRAIGLLIIVGDHETLSTDDNWKFVIDYISENGGLFRDKTKLNPRI